MTNPNDHLATIKFYLAVILNYFIAAIPWALALDWGTKLITLSFASWGFWYMRKRHLQDMKNKMLEEENNKAKKRILDQEEYQLIMKNKLLSTTLKQAQEQNHHQPPTE